MWQRLMVTFPPPLENIGILSTTIAMFPTLTLCVTLIPPNTIRKHDPPTLLSGHNIKKRPYSQYVSPGHIASYVNSQMKRITSFFAGTPGFIILIHIANIMFAPHFHL